MIKFVNVGWGSSPDVLVLFCASVFSIVIRSFAFWDNVLLPFFFSLLFGRIHIEKTGGEVPIF